MGDGTDSPETDRDGFSRRSLLKRSSAAAIGGIVGGGLLGTVTPNAAGASPFDDSKQLEEILGEALTETVSRHPLPVPAHRDSSIISIELTDPRTTVLFDVKTKRTLLASRDVTPTSGVILTAATAHELISGQTTPAMALASGKITLVGDKRELGALHNLPTAARSVYEKKMKSAGKGRRLRFNQKDVV